MMPRSFVVGASIDKTGENRIMTWLLESFSADVSVESLEQTSLEMPRLDAYLASQLMEPKHLRGELCLQFQAYAEKEQLRGRAPLGRVLLNMVARRFFLDLSRGANLTQQSLLELDISAYILMKASAPLLIALSSFSIQSLLICSHQS